MIVICYVGKKLTGFVFLRGTEYLYPSFFQLFKKYIEATLVRCVCEKVHLFMKYFIKLIIRKFVFSDFSGDEVVYNTWNQLYFPYKQLKIFNNIPSVFAK